MILTLVVLLVVLAVVGGVTVHSLLFLLMVPAGLVLYLRDRRRV